MDGGEWWLDDEQLRYEPYRYAEIMDIPLDELMEQMRRN